MVHARLDGSRGSGRRNRHGGGAICVWRRRHCRTYCWSVISIPGHSRRRTNRQSPSRNQVVGSLIAEIDVKYSRGVGTTSYLRRGESRRVLSSIPNKCVAIVRGTGNDNSCGALACDDHVDTAFGVFDRSRYHGVTGTLAGDRADSTLHHQLLVLILLLLHSGNGLVVARPGPVGARLNYLAVFILGHGNYFISIRLACGQADFLRRLFGIVTLTHHENDLSDGIGNCDIDIAGNTGQLRLSPYDGLPDSNSGEHAVFQGDGVVWILVNRHRSWDTVKDLIALRTASGFDHALLADP